MPIVVNVLFQNSWRKKPTGQDNRECGTLSVEISATTAQLVFETASKRK